LRETQLEQGQAITGLGEKVDQLTGTVGHLRDQHGVSLTEIVGLPGRTEPQPLIPDRRVKLI
jgi:hypothetical protein